MIKKIIISSVAFFGMSLVALYHAHNVETVTTDKVLEEITGDNSIVVLELFTSQGCSSCPPADRLLQQVKQEYPENVFALSYHVDYWNYIGWEDPFSNPAYSVKQRNYTRKFNYRSNYTPQIVVNGMEHFVGSNASKLYAKIEDYSVKAQENQVSLEKVSLENDRINFNFNVDGTVEGRQLRAVLVLDERTTEVKRGENRNRTLKNSNIVVAENYINLGANAGIGSVKVPSLVRTSDKMTLMVLIESDNQDITAAAKYRIR